MLDSTGDLETYIVVTLMANDGTAGKCCCV